MMRLVGVVLPLLVAGCTVSPSAVPMPASAAAPSSAPASPSGPAVLDCGSFTLRQGEDMPKSALRCFLEAYRAKRAARLEQIAPSVEGYPVREEYITNDAGSIAVTIDSSQDPYGGLLIERQVCSGVAVTAIGRLTFAGCGLG